MLKALLVIGLLLVACGGSDEKMLHLDGYDVSERTAQLSVRADLANAGPLVFAACKQFNDMSPKEALAYLDAQRKGTPVAETPPAGATMKPGQKADDKSRERSAEIFLAECKRLSGAG